MDGDKDFNAPEELLSHEGGSEKPDSKSRQISWI